MAKKNKEKETKNKRSKEKLTDKDVDVLEEENQEEQEDELFGEVQSHTEEELARLKADFEKEAMPFMPLLRNYAIKITGDEDNADDLLQETYMRAYRFFDKFEKGTNCKAWLFRIMKNLFINNYRKNQKTPNQVDYGEIENFYESIKSDRLETGDMQEITYNNLLDDDVTHALNSLQDDFKTVIILCDIEGLSYEEIADFVQCPVGTVRSRLHRGRKLLQQKLKRYAEKKGYDVESNMIL